MRFKGEKKKRSSTLSAFGTRKWDRPTLGDWPKRDEFRAKNRCVCNWVFAGQGGSGGKTKAEMRVDTAKPVRTKRPQKILQDHASQNVSKKAGKEIN